MVDEITPSSIQRALQTVGATVVGNIDPPFPAGCSNKGGSAWIVADDFSDRSFRAIEDLSEVTCGYDEN